MNSSFHFVTIWQNLENSKRSASLYPARWPFLEEKYEAEVPSFVSGITQTWVKPGCTAYHLCGPGKLFYALWTSIFHREMDTEIVWLLQEDDVIDGQIPTKIAQRMSTYLERKQKIVGMLLRAGDKAVGSHWRCWPLRSSALCEVIKIARHFTSTARLFCKAWRLLRALSGDSVKLPIWLACPGCVVLSSSHRSWVGNSLSPFPSVYCDIRYHFTLDIPEVRSYSNTAHVTW